METRCWLTCGLLALCLGLTAGRVRGESVHEWTLRSPCDGVKCAHHTNILKTEEINKNDHDVSDDTSFLTKSHRPLSLLPRRSPFLSRVRRQTVSVEVDEGKRGGAKSHRLECTRSEERKAACMKGTCYALNMGHWRDAFCECPAMYEGDRCQQLSSYYFLMYSAELKKAAIIGGVVVGIIIIIVVISLYCSFRKGRKKRKENDKKPDNIDGTSDKLETAAMIPDGESPV